MIERLTPEQEARFPEFIKKWTDIGLSTEPADRPRAEKAIRLMYRSADLAVPRIVWCGSPLANALTWASVGASVRDSVRDSVGASVLASVGDSVWDGVGDSVWDGVGASVRDSVWDGVWASVWDSVRDSVYGQHDAHWLGYYDYMNVVLALKEQTAPLKGLWELALSAGWALPHEKICWVSERHSVLKRDELGRLHSDDTPAVQYP